MSFEISLNGAWDGEYQTVMANNECEITLNISPYSFEGYLKDLFKEAPNDFRDVVRIYLIDCAIKYFDANPISEEEKERFFELLDGISEFDYEGEE